MNMTPSKCVLYLHPQLVDAGNLSEVTDVSQQPTLLAVAAFFSAKDAGEVRLIDNIVLGEV